jgi:hypothetical protein
MQRYQLNANGPERGQVLANVLAFLQRLPANRSWRIEVKEARKERTGDQNAALFGVAYAVLTEATGYTPEELHHEFCGRFFGWTEFEIFGESRRRPRRTTTTNEQGDRDVIDTATFARFYDEVQRVGAEAGIDVPSPDPMHGQRGRWAA